MTEPTGPEAPSIPIAYSRISGGWGFVVVAVLPLILILILALVLEAQP